MSPFLIATGVILLLSVLTVRFPPSAVTILTTLLIPEKPKNIQRVYNFWNDSLRRSNYIHNLRISQRLFRRLSPPYPSGRPHLHMHSLPLCSKKGPT